MRSQVMAVVVTYNRLELLQENIRALQSQVTPCDILVINNASTDGTVDKIPEMLLSCGYREDMEAKGIWGQMQEPDLEESMRLFQREEQRIYFATLEENLGGAGGFSHGMKRAVQLGYAFVWIMDDDTIPHADTLQKLLESASELGAQPAFGFLSSTVLWTDGSPCLMNGQHVVVEDAHLPQVDTATFVSLFFPRQVILEMGLPMGEYFIWGDDKEYTNRLARRYPCYWVKDSVVTHKMRVNAGSNITTDELSKVPRYFYAYRNDYVTARQQGLWAMLIYQLAYYLNRYRVRRFAVDGVKERLEVMKRGRAAGRSFHPEIEYIK